ncbi:polysaccharide lyase family 8 super-sandwich domain-containing protein [Algoriphagus sp. PAP.12]|uniref:polysaccharide lyase family 8 super-sandwich domain-containing protein n=1 Tax=Algoriphagus sp. PAP.12 TaxID=2996678 RepID=UPI00227AF1C8|nr:polysaccharide lyase family 8 super-sandwich domain-containing protein [Algoriphagus sp. PAP.12]
MKNYNRVFTFFIFIFLISISNSFAQEENEYDQILGKIYREYQSSPRVSDLNKEAKILMASLKSNGSWEGINYKDQAGTRWQPDKHLKQLGILVKAYTRTTSDLYESSDLYDKIITAMNYWVNLNPAPKSSNWWWLSISVPKEIGNMLASMRFGKKKVPQDLEKKLIEWMNKTVSITKSPGKDGANLTDMAQHRIMQAALTKNEELLSQTVHLTSESIKFSNGDGIQKDYSFHAHGPELYIHGYGMEYLSGIRNIQVYVQGTRFSYTTEQMDLISDFVKKGYLQVIRGKYLDYSVIGRGIARNNASRTNSTLIKNLKAIVPDGDNPAYENAIKRIDGDEPPNFGVEPSNTHYWRSDYTVHNRPGFMATVNIASNRSIRTESGNGENLVGQFLTEGAMYLATGGNEYFNIFPVWKWYMIPGTTTPAVKNLKKRTNWVAVKGLADFVGGVSDGLNGVTTFAMDAYETKAKKGWFFFDDKVICLGAEISANRDEPIYTTINQSLQKGDVQYSENVIFEKLTEPEHHFKQGIKWAFHDEIAYFFPQSQDIWLSAKSQSGSWKEINSNSSDKVIEMDVFSLWIDHGKNPKNDSYEYIIIPGIESPDAISSASVSSIEIVENSSDIQAVWDNSNKLLGVVFYKKGKLEWDGNTISIDQPGVVLACQTNDNEWTINYADPTQKLTGSVKAEIKIDSNSESLNFQLPTGNMAGSTVSEKVSF